MKSGRTMVITDSKSCRVRSVLNEVSCYLLPVVALIQPTLCFSSVKMAELPFYVG